MAKVPHGVEILPKISITWVGCTNVTDDRRQTERQTDRRWHIANMNFSSRSLKTAATRLWSDISNPCVTPIRNSRLMRFRNASRVKIISPRVFVTDDIVASSHQTLSRWSTFKASNKLTVQYHYPSQSFSTGQINGVLPMQIKAALVTDWRKKTWIRPKAFISSRIKWLTVFWMTHWPSQWMKAVSCCTISVIAPVTVTFCEALDG